MLKRVIDFLKEYLSVVAIMPLILGGVWQVLSLASMSPSYIRFFSVSQQIADGILILFVFSILSVVWLFLKGAFEKTPDLENWIRLSNFTLLFYLLISSIATVFSFYIIFDILYFFLVKKERILSLSDVGMFLIFLVTCVYSTKSLYVTILSIFTKNNFRFISIRLYNQIKFLIATVLFCGIVLITVITLIKSVFTFQSMFSFPSDLKNIQYVLNKYQKENRGINADSIKFLYMNDKYIFIKDSSKVQVVKFDYMFSE